jgi:hypothetical protein
MFIDPTGHWNWNAFWTGVGKVTIVAAAVLTTTAIIATAPVSLTIIAGAVVVSTVATYMTLDAAADFGEAITDDYQSMRDGVFQRNYDLCGKVSTVAAITTGYRSEMLGAYAQYSSYNLYLKQQIEPYLKVSRQQVMGGTPQKKSPTGRAVIQEGINNGTVKTINGKQFFLSPTDNKWYPIKEADMSHRTDCVTWWNNIAYKFGEKSPEVRDFMLNPNNYYLEHFKWNRSSGAQIRETYCSPDSRWQQ